MTLLPIAFCHSIGHIGAVVSAGAGAVSFTQIVKAAAPVFTPSRAFRPAERQATARPPAGALAAHVSPAGWASPVSSTTTPWAQGPWAPGPTGPGAHNFTFFGCRSLYPELLPDPLGVVSPYSRPDISHFGASGWISGPAADQKFCIFLRIFPLKGPVLVLSYVCGNDGGRRRDDGDREGQHSIAKLMSAPASC